VRADGDDPDPEYEDPEETASGSQVTYRVVIDNDTQAPVMITSLIDDMYPGVSCVDSSEADVAGATLAADDGDKELVTEKGPDAVVCTFTETVSGTSGQELVNTTTVTIGEGTDSLSDVDSVIVVIS
jgi:hypothetical protein